MQDGRPQCQGDGLPEVGGVHQRQEPQGRHSGVDRQGRSEPAQILINVHIRPLLTDIERGRKLRLQRSDLAVMLRLSKKADYALIAMKHLAQKGERSTSAREIAEQYGIP